MKNYQLPVLCMLSILATAAITPNARAQHTPIPAQPGIAPQIELDGVGIGTIELRTPRNTLTDGTKLSTGRINFSDSALLLGVSERLYRQGGIGSFVLGATTTDSSLNGTGTGLLLHQLYLNYSIPSLEATLGRTDTATRLIDFPTLRGDDLVEFTAPLDPFSSGGDIQEHRYSNQAAVTFNSKLRYFVNLHAQHLLNSVDAGSDQTGLNSYGISFRYMSPPALDDITRIPEWGVGYERQEIPASHGGANNVLYAGMVYNINPDPVDRVDLRLQDVYSTGNNLATFTSITDTYRAAANSIALSLRWLHSPFGTPGFQVALTGGYRSYQSVPRSDTFALALTGIKNLGQGFDLVAQYTFQYRAAAYAAPFGGSTDNSFQLGFLYNFTNTFNHHLGARRSLLNLQHQYIPD